MCVQNRDPTARGAAQSAWRGINTRCGISDARRGSSVSNDCRRAAPKIITARTARHFK